MVSIITPSYNQAAFIEATLRSVLLQDYEPVELIVVDGGSTDGTIDILRRYGAWIRWTSEPDRGQADAINKGLAQARGEYLAYLNSDDVYFPGAIRRVVECFERQPQLGLVYGDGLMIDADGRPLGLIPPHEFDVERMIRWGEFIPQQATFWRRAATEAVGLFDARLHFAMDQEYFIRIGRRFPAQRLPEVIAGFRLHGESKTSTREEAHWREVLEVSRRFGLRPWHPAWWVRVMRHNGLRALPGPLQLRLRRWLGRPQDPYPHAHQSRPGPPPGTHP